MKQLPDFYPAKGKLDPEVIYPSFVTKPKNMTKKDWKRFVDEKVDESMFLEYGKPKVKKTKPKLNISKVDVKGFTSIICKKCGKEFKHVEPELCDDCKIEDSDAPYW
jgi:predicted nucleic-acid-binding Zn-ribbon protein